MDGPHLYHFAHNAPGTLTDHFGYAGTGVDNWLAKTELAKAIAPFAVRADDKVTFAAEVGTKLAVNAAIGFGMGLCAHGGSVGLALGAVMLGGGLTPALQLRGPSDRRRRQEQLQRRRCWPRS